MENDKPFWKERLETLQMLASLTPAQFDWLLEVTQIPQHLIAPQLAEQGRRASDFMRLAQTQRGLSLAEIQEVILDILNGPKNSFNFKYKRSVEKADIGKQEDLWIVDDITIETVRIDGGDFLMGSPDMEGNPKEEEPQHRVKVQTFWMGKYPITQKQWQAIVCEDEIDLRLPRNPFCFYGENLPVESVNWYEACEFCERLSRRVGHKCRLPSEAEWEFACRAGETAIFSVGEDLTNEQANFGYHPRLSTTPVGQYKYCNGFGLYDMHGNVWEWCLDHWHSSYAGAPKDGRAWSINGEHTKRVIRGGAWNYYKEDCRSARRFKYEAENKGRFIGFRIVCENLEVKDT